MAPRFRVEPRDIPGDEAARRMGMGAGRFRELLPRLIARGFPCPDPDTGNFDLDAIDAWRRSRHPHLFVGELIKARDAGTVVTDRIASMRRG
jgi:hypothetical protein